MANFGNTYPFVAMSQGKIDPLSEIQNANIVTSGSVFWVKSVSDSDFTTFQNQVGVSNVFQGIQAAINKARADKNDFIMVCPKDTGAAWTADQAGTAINLNKARVHLLSVGYGRSSNGYTNTIQGFGTTVAIDTAVLKVTAPGCEIAGFRFLGTSGTNANGTMTDVVQLGTASSGTAHQTWMHDVVIEETNTTGGAAGTTSLLTFTTGVNGFRADNVKFIGASLGNISVNLPINGSRHEFHDSQFLMNAAATANKFVVTGTGANDYVLFTRCKFTNINTGQLPASAVTGSITAASAVVLMDYCTYTNVTQAGTDPNVYKAPAESGTSTAVRDLGIAVGSAALIPA